MSYQGPNVKLSINNKCKRLLWMKTLMSKVFIKLAYYDTMQINIHTAIVNVKYTRIIRIESNDI